MADEATTTEPAALYERRGNVALITLNRPKALNAVNAALSTAVGTLLEQAEADDDVRVVVITGAGRAFCAGADLKALAAGENTAADGHPEWGFAGYVQHWISKPTIAAVNGFALGGGTELVLASDLAVVDEEAKLGLPEVKRGLFAAAGGVIRLQQQIPRKIALELALTGEPITAAEGKELGLVNRIAPAGTALEVALELAEKIAANAPLSVRESKAMIHRTAHADDWGSAAWDANIASMKVVFTSEDAKEGPTAFAEKREPVWKGR
ncbi:crotonase/enoyl-CoA hydratase family protein [Rhodococcus sp. NPDC003382]|uniref:crotonase/enoyl-CoA hydratase family protein n=1 Tax=unclassified Rhodococcus (in: high G+C Gram-positive bacteria) TaxID=192944 RepID=UPI0018CD6478|nr:MULTISPECIES: crotonase/enoyl-CoA hydratase family protein [unclassified Rhodococcus (in: high G+C Gram-positive bacteria)]MBH0118654.1 crotonase/enoyl-CoA hydratase family protein [Rhodococcus sp. CX]MCK8671107.1 crotonase/enoyl-CoA hydratase family protein [Rhodococcus sp. HM1]